MKLFIVLILAFWLTGCDSRSINSTYLLMKEDMVWLTQFCPSADKSNILYKGTFVHMSIECDQIQNFEDWESSTTHLLESNKWVKFSGNGESSEFCNSVSGVYLRLTHGKHSTSTINNKSYLAMRFPEGVCAKYRPNPYQPLASEKTSNQLDSNE